jgi:hypothetical protein
MIQRQLGLAQQLLPEAEAGQLALIEGGPINPVKAVKPLLRQASDTQHVGPRRGVRWSGQYDSIVEDHRAQSQSSSLAFSVRPCNVD